MPEEYVFTEHTARSPPPWRHWSRALHASNHGCGSIRHSLTWCHLYSGFKMLWWSVASLATAIFFSRPGFHRRSGNYEGNNDTPKYFYGSENKVNDLSRWSKFLIHERWGIFDNIATMERDKSYLPDLILAMVRHMVWDTICNRISY